MSRHPGFDTVVNHIAKNYPEGKNNLMAWIRDVVVLQKPTYPLVLVGPEASGKSTFARLLIELPLPFSLTVVDGQEGDVYKDRINKITCANTYFLMESDEAVVVNCDSILHSDHVTISALVGSIDEKRMALRTVIDFETSICESA